MSKAQEMHLARLAELKKQQEADEMAKNGIPPETPEAEKLTLVVENPPPVADLSTADDLEIDFFVYGSDRTKRAKTMLSLYLLNETIIDIPYIQIRKVKSQQNALIQLFTGDSIITIEGTKVNLIRERIKHGSLSYVREGGKRNPPQTPDGVAVYSIIETSFADLEE
jgi:hypothetical protein